MSAQAAPVEGWVILVDMPHAFPATGFGSHWNGWATPSFSIEVGREIVAALGAWYGNALSAREYTSADGKPCALVAYGDATVAISDAAIALASTLTEGDALRDFLTDPTTGLEIEAHALGSIGWGSWVWERFDSQADALAALAEAAQA